MILQIKLSDKLDVKLFKAHISEKIGKLQALKLKLVSNELYVEAHMVKEMIEDYKNELLTLKN